MRAPTHTAVIVGGVGLEQGVIDEAGQVGGAARGIIDGHMGIGFLLHGAGILDL